MKLPSYSHISSAHLQTTQPTRYDIEIAGLKTTDNTALLLIDSRDRNHDVWPSPAEYQIKLDPPYREVVSIELLSANVPNNAYVINTSHNLLYFQESEGHIATDTWLIAEIPVGNRTIENICECISSAMTAASHEVGGIGFGFTYECSVNEYTGYVTITQLRSEHAGPSSCFILGFAGIPEKIDPPSHREQVIDEITGRHVWRYSGRYRATYRPRSIAPIIGFKRQVYSEPTETVVDSVTTYSYTGSYVYDLCPFKYIALFVNQSQTFSNLSKIDTPNTFIKGAFCILPVGKMDDTGFNYLADNYQFIKYFSTPVGEINEFNIKFTDADGNLFDFNGHDHRLLFSIKTNNRKAGFTE